MSHSTGLSRVRGGLCGRQCLGEGLLRNVSSIVDRRSAVVRVGARRAAILQNFGQGLVSWDGKLGKAKFRYNRLDRLNVAHDFVVVG